MAKVTVKLTDDRRQWDKLMGVLKQLKSPVVAVGYPENKSPSSVIAYATYNHYGVPGHIPARPFIAVAIDQNKEKIFNLKKKLIDMTLGGTFNVPKALGILGTFVQDRIKETISGSFFEENVPNALSTAAAKGSTHPLENHLTMKNSTTYEVRLKGDAK